MEVAGTESFASPAVQQHGEDVRLTRPLTAGTWWWRVRSVAAAGKTGPWSDALRFRMIDNPLDAVPTAEEESSDDSNLPAHWS
ncbi:hypothetical protein LMO80_14230, partial [Staphylococcus aureus]|nr:hypothetical protein [Staphylococcus aureus]